MNDVNAQKSAAEKTAVHIPRARICEFFCTVAMHMETLCFKEGHGRPPSLSQQVVHLNILQIVFDFIRYLLNRLVTNTFT